MQVRISSGELLCLNLFLHNKKAPSLRKKHSTQPGLLFVYFRDANVRIFLASDGDDDSDLLVHRSGLRETCIDDEDCELRDVQVSNPWTIAKVNAPIQRSAKTGGNSRMLTPARQRGDVENGPGQSPNEILPVPRALPSPDRTPRDDASARNISSSPERFPYPLTARKRRAQTSTTEFTSPPQHLNHDRCSHGALDRWVQKSLANPDFSSSLNTRRDPDFSPYPPTVRTNESDDGSLFIDPQTEETQPRDFVSARTLPIGTPLSEIPSIPQRPAQNLGSKKLPKRDTGITKPFISPVNEPHKVWFDADPTSGRRGRSPRKRHQQSGHDHEQNQAVTDDPIDSDPEAQTQHVHPDLAMTLDYEARKAEAIKHRKAYLRQQVLKGQHMAFSPSPPSSFTASNINSPHANRYNKATAALEPPSKDATAQDNAASPGLDSAFEASDPRGYLLRLQRRSQTPGMRSDCSVSPSRARSGTSSRRRKTAMLPLETIDESCATRDLALPLSSQVINLTKIEKNMDRIAETDKYVGSGKVICGLEEAKNIKIVRGWEDKISTWIGERYKRYVETGEQRELKIELWPILQNHLASQDGCNGTNEVVG